MQSAHRKQLDQLVRLDRLRLLSAVCLVLGLVALAFGVEYMGGWSGIANPKNWASAHAAFVAAGGLRWLVAPLIVMGLVLFVVGGLLCIFIAKRDA